MAAITFQPVALERETRAVPPLHPLWQDLLDRLEQPLGTAQATTPPIDFRAFLAALQDTAHQSTQTAKESAKEVTGPVQPNAPPSYPPLATETRATLPTPEAAYHLNRAQQTLRLWAMRQDGPVRPLRINGRLAWKVCDLKRLLGVA
jgi:hypothetical protein